MSTATQERNAADHTELQAANNGFSLISVEKLLQLYTAMVKCRILEERASALLQTRVSGGANLACIGQEAAAVGVAIALLSDDTICPSHLDFLVSFLRGASLDAMFQPLIERSTSPDNGHFPSAHVDSAFSNTAAPAAKLAERFDIATQAGLANKADKNGRIAVAFLGEETTSLSAWHQACKAASAEQLPILFVCPNSLEDALRGLSLQVAVEDLQREAQVFGIPCITVDGNDVVAVYRVASEAIAHARRGNGPTLIECKMVHWGGHVETYPAHSGFNGAVQSSAHDPILNMEQYLRNKRLYSEDLRQKTIENFKEELDAAIEAVKEAHKPVDAKACN